MNLETVIIVTVIVIIFFLLGFLIGWRCHRPDAVGSLLLIKDPIDGETFMQLEVDRNKADYIYDGNEISMNVVEILSKGPRKTQSL